MFKKLDGVKIMMITPKAGGRYTLRLLADGGAYYEAILLPSGEVFTPEYCWENLSAWLIAMRAFRCCPCEVKKEEDYDFLR